MKRVFYFLLLLGGSLSAQKDPYRFSDTLRANFSKDTVPWKTQLAAWDFSYIGDYKSTLEMWDRGYYKPGPLAAADSAYFSQFHPVDAKSYILERAKNEQIIIINEAHHQPMHRVFTTSLLPGLYALGFRYFCAETLDKADTLLNERKYPVQESGYYLKEPQYGNLVRTALQTGYTVIAYDYGSTSVGDGGKGREISAAKNIKAILDKDPSAKILIHCGFDHIIEAPYEAWEKALAGRIKEYTGIDPFTIDQVKLTESSSGEYDNPFFAAVNLDYYAVFMDSAGKLFSGQPSNRQYDVRVYHPRTRWENGRPHWMFENGKHPHFFHPPGDMVYPCLVQAYYADEDPASAIPIDVIELRSKDDKTALALPAKGNIILLVKDAAGKTRWVPL